MNLIITGFPGVGKGTQSEKICSLYNIKHLSTGDLFRSEISKKTELGEQLNSYMKNGNLVPDELTIELFKNELKKEKYSNGFLLDGFPRTKLQAKNFMELISKESINLDGVINLKLDESVIINRVVNRLVCISCGATYHKDYVKPHVAGKCDKCSSELIQRKDDTLEAIKNRLELARDETLPVINYFEKNNLVYTVLLDENDSTCDVFKKVASELKKIKVIN
jgi:adenylate kinase